MILHSKLKITKRNKYKFLVTIGILLIFSNHLFSFPNKTLYSYSDISLTKLNYKDSSETKIQSDSITITVLVDFIVNENGEIKNVKAKKADCKKCDKSTKEHFMREAEKVIESSPKWEPGIDSNGKPRSVSFRMPIIFKIVDN